MQLYPAKCCTYELDVLNRTPTLHQTKELNVVFPKKRLTFNPYSYVELTVLTFSDAN